MRRRNFQWLLGISSFFLIICFENCAVVPNSELDDSQMALSASQSVAQKGFAVLQRNCISCHNDSNPQGGVNLQDANTMLYYRLIVPGEPQLSDVYKVMVDGVMPPGKLLSATDIESVNNWIATGFEDVGTVTTPPASGGTTLQAKYSSLMQNVFNSKCLSCHSSAKGFGGVVLDKYSAVQGLVTAGSPQTSVLYTAVATGKMAGRMTASELAVLRDWITAGAPNN